LSQLSFKLRPAPVRLRRLRSQADEAQDVGFTASSKRARRAASQISTKQSLAKQGLRIGRTPVGKGLFATKRIVDGACIGEIHGLVIDDDEYVSRYAFDLDDGRQLEPEAPFRYVNHSCEPNCAFQNFSFAPLPASPNRPEAAPRRKLLLFSICDIAVGQELTIDYNWPAIFAIPCDCRSAGCRGWIVTPKDLAQLLDVSLAVPGRGLGVSP